MDPLYGPPIWTPYLAAVHVRVFHERTTVLYGTRGTRGTHVHTRGTRAHTRRTAEGVDRERANEAALLRSPYSLPTLSLLYPYSIPTLSLLSPYSLPTLSLLYPYSLPTLSRRTRG